MLIFGAGGHAGKVTSIAAQLGLTIDGYISTEPPGTVIRGYLVLGYLDRYLESQDLLEIETHIAIGENSVRHDIYSALGRHVGKVRPVISTASTMAADVLPGRGAFVGDSAVIQGGSKIGVCALVDTAAVVEHDTTIGDFVTISPGAILCGGAKVCNGAIVGAGATVIEKITIGENSLVGAGSVVLHDVGPNLVVVGNPARVLRQRQFSDRYLR